MTHFALNTVLRSYRSSTLVSEILGDIGDRTAAIGATRLAMAGSADGPDRRLAVRCEEPGSEEIAFGFRLSFPGLQNAHLSMPAAVYAGNRFRSKPYAYSCIVCDPEDFRADLPNTISNVPRLPRIQLLAGDVSMPAIGLIDSASGKGIWVLTDPDTRVGQPMLEAIEDENGISLAVVAPGVREGERYAGCGEHWAPSEDRGWIPGRGAAAEIRIRIHEFEASGPHDLYQKLFELRHEIWPAGGRQEIPWSAAEELLEAKFNELNWDESDGYYACGDRKSRYANWQVGWVGGGISSHALLSVGDDLSRSRAMRTMDFMSGKGQSPSGFYWSFCVDGQVYSDMIDMDYGHDWHLVRRSGDALYFLVKQIWLAKRQGRSSETWTRSVETCANAFVRLWRNEGQFGQFVSQETGEIRVGATTSGAIAPAGLALAYQLTGQSPYLETAEASALSMVEKFLDLGYTSGGPGEAAQCPDSESAFGLLESLVTLFEVTGERRWVELAERAAWLSASWVMPYDFRFPPQSSFARLDMRTTGSVWANSQNKHSAPGICTLSGVSLFKLFRATGDRRYLDLLGEIAHGVVQYLSRKDRPVFGMAPGYMCERVNTSDWEHPTTPVGEGFDASCWCETSALLTYAEVPGLYVRPDTGLVAMLDHGGARVAGRSDQALEVEVVNPTAFPMDLTPFGELSGDSATVLGQDFLFDLPRVSIAAGGKALLRFDSSSGRFIP